MPLKRKKICLIFFGGTTLSEKDPQNSSIREEKDIQNWMRQMPELEIMAEIKPVFVYGGPAVDVTPQDWIRLAQEIYQRYNQYDGFVVTHGMDTLIYTASTLSFMLQNLGKPIVFTGSQIPDSWKGKPPEMPTTQVFKEYGGLGVRANLINAIQVATLDIAEVCIMFGNRLIRANQAIKTGILSLNIFDSFSTELLGKVDFGIRLLENRKKRSRGKIKFKPKLDFKIHLLELFPGIDPQIIEKALKQKWHGLVLKAYDIKPFPNFIFKTLDKAKIRNLPIIVHTLSQEPGSKSNLIFISNMTLETTIVKLMWVLGQTKELGQVRRLMVRNLMGEGG